MAASNNSGLQSHLETFFSTMLQEIYWSEQQLINVLTTMENAATASELKSLFKMHREQTRSHVKRLEETFKILNLPAQAERSAGLQGLFDEGWHVIDETPEGSAQRDMALIIAAQKVEHYEMACYGSLITLARTLEKDQIPDLFKKTLEEEKQTDILLTHLAEQKINPQAYLKKFPSSHEGAVTKTM